MKDALEAFTAHYRKDNDSSKGSTDHVEYESRHDV